MGQDRLYEEFIEEFYEENPDATEEEAEAAYEEWYRFATCDPGAVEESLESLKQQRVGGVLGLIGIGLILRGCLG